MYVDTLKNKRARTVPLVPAVVPIVDRWSAGKSPGEWLFAAPAGGPLPETNWQRSVSWREAKAAIGRPELRVHDLRHTAASVWLASGADPKVVQRVLGHATAAMTMDLYGHMIDRNLWDPAMIMREIISAISRAKDELVDAARYRELAEAMRNAASTPEKAYIPAAMSAIEIPTFAGVSSVPVIDRSPASLCTRRSYAFLSR